MSESGKSPMVMRKAFEGIIAVLGPTGKDAIISELRSRCKYDADYVSAEIVRDTLKRLFGPDSAELLLEQSVVSKSYRLDIRKLGWRMADLLISVEKGKAEETAQKLLESNRVSVIKTSLRIGNPQVDIMADVFYRDSIELHNLTERVKAMPYVTFVEWAEVVKVVGSNYDSILERVFANVGDS